MYVNMDKEYKISINVTPRPLRALRAKVCYSTKAPANCVTTLLQPICRRKSSCLCGAGCRPGQTLSPTCSRRLGIGMELSSLTNALQLGSAL